MYQAMKLTHKETSTIKGREIAPWPEVIGLHFNFGKSYSSQCYGELLMEINDPEPFY